MAVLLETLDRTGFWRIALPARGRGQVETPIALNVPFRAGATWALGGRELFYYPPLNDPAVPFPPVRAVDVETGRTRDLPVEKIRLGRGSAFAGRTLAIAHAKRSRSDADNDRRVKEACIRHVTNHAAGDGRCRGYRVAETTAGKDSAAADRLIPIVFRELHDLAELYIRREGPSHTLQPTALVHECYLRLVADQARDWQNRAQFIGVAASIMRRLLIDHARRKRAEKRQLPETLEWHGGGMTAQEAEELLDLNLAPGPARERRIHVSREVVELRYFGGLSIEKRPK